MWCFRHYGNPEPTDVDWQADGEGNGLLALQEYAWGGAAFQPLPVGYDPELIWTAGGLDYCYNRRAAGTTELSYQTQYTLDLQSWSDLPGAPLIEAHPTMPGFERARQAVPLTSSALFLRLRASLP